MHKILLMDKALMLNNSWSRNFSNLCKSLGWEKEWETLSPISISYAKKELMTMYSRQWRAECTSKTKLQNYNMIKEFYQCEGFLMTHLSKGK